MLLFLQGADFLIPSAITFVLTLILAFAYHEFAHALVADWLGDPTPRSFGRITLNPIAHLDRTGLILALLFGFGWAMTPINPSYMRGNPRVARAIVSVAGPIANLLMAILFGLPIRFGLVDVMPPGAVLPSVYSFLTFGVYLNLLLFVFNLLPIPPLDGWSILMGILPAELAYRLRPIEQYGFLIFMAVIFFLPSITGINVFGTVIGTVLRSLFPIILGDFQGLFI